MRTGFIIVGCFAAGCVAGRCGWLPASVTADTGAWTAGALYVLMVAVGISLGSDRKLREILRSVRPRLLLVPLATIAGTLAATALASLFIARWGLPECMAVGSGFCYYSLSSILITELAAPALGVQAATELGTVALMANLIRELLVMLTASFMVRRFGRLAPICAGGASTLDTTLPMIIRYSGKDMAFIAIFHAIMVDFSVPFFVSVFCSMI
ncbi:MAG: lysine exporter LysO family protein [Tannerella sp.]|jgi:uncharacterized membrane protein YbjE (DUF340 family)|nr:lysine exporter LysO family protein [Tannerella sp.]